MKRRSTWFMGGISKSMCWSLWHSFSKNTVPENVLHAYFYGSHTPGPLSGIKSNRSEDVTHSALIHSCHWCSNVSHRDKLFLLQVIKTCTKRLRRYQIPSLGTAPLNGSQKLQVLPRHSGHHLKNVDFKGFNPEKSKQNSVNVGACMVETYTA